MAKAGSLVASAALAVALLGTWEYSVEAPFTLKTEDLAVVAAPFDGFLGEAKVAQDAMGRGEVPIRDHGDQVGKRLLVTGLSSCHEIGIHAPAIIRVGTSDATPV